MMAFMFHLLIIAAACAAAVIIDYIANGKGL